MEQLQFERLKNQVAAASAAQILEFEDVIQRVSSPLFVEMALARRTKKTIKDRICPHCQGNNIVLHGKDQNRRQRFKCRGCGKTYNIMTGTPMARARKPTKWCAYLCCMTDHMSLRKILASGIGVHMVTAWRWRHRFLKAAVKDNAAVLSGVVEAGETFFPQSFKGSRSWKNGKPPENRAARLHGRCGTAHGLSPHQVPVLTALDNSGGVYWAILKSLTEIANALQGRIAAGSVLCSAPHGAYVNAAEKLNAEHYVVVVATNTPFSVAMNPVPISSPNRHRLGLGRVNRYHEHLRHLIIGRCRGIATKYLGGYLGWHRVMNRSGFEGKMLLIQALS